MMWTNRKFLHIWHVCDVENASTCVKFMLFCCKIGFVAIYALLSQICFVAIYALLCGEKTTQITPKCGEKNDKYKVCLLWKGQFLKINLTVQTGWRSSSQGPKWRCFGDFAKRLSHFFHLSRWEGKGQHLHQRATDEANFESLIPTVGSQQFAFLYALWNKIWQVNWKKEI